MRKLDTRRFNCRSASQRAQHRAARPTAASRPMGFTLIEILSALALMAIVTAFAIPRINTARFQMDQNARTIRAALQLAQRLAVTRQYDVIVSFDVQGGRVRIAQDANNDMTLQTSERVTWKSLEYGARFSTPPVGLNGAVGAAVVGSNIRTIGGYPSVVLRRDGAASSDFEVYLTSATNQPGDFRAVTIAQPTGRPDWSRLLNGKWIPAGL